MATSSCALFTPLLNHHKLSPHSHPQNSTHNSNGTGPHCSFIGRMIAHHSPLKRKRRSKGRFVVQNGSPEAAGDILSSLSIPGFSDSPWVTGIAGLLVVVPFLVQRLLTLTKEVDVATQTVEKIADAMEKMAEEVDKAAEDVGEGLPEGGLKKVVNIVEDLAEETTKDAQKIEDLMDKVEELDDKLESFLEKQSKGTKKD